MYRKKSKERNGLEKGLLLPAYPSDFKMVKVNKGKKGGRKTSLVFRISRSQQVASDDSGIKCSSPSEDETSSVQEQLQEPARSPLKIKIPRSLLLNPDNNESGLSECDTSVDSTFQNVKENFDILNKSIDVKDDKNNLMDTDYPPLPTSKPVESRSYDLRSSSRQVLLRVQKESKQHFLPKIASSVENPPFLNSIDKNHLVPAISIKRRRGRKPGTQSKAADTKIRKYGRRGRPPKELLPSDLNISKPIIVGNIKNENEIVLQPLKNTVWTLVPKELFESEYFKSQVIKVHNPNTLNTRRLDTSLSFPSIATPRPIIPQTNGQIQFKAPKYMVSPRPIIQQMALENKGYKRPTVIYCRNERKNVNECSADHRTLANLSTEQPQPNNEHMKNRNDLSYLLSKYFTLEDIVITTIYELTTYDVNTTDAILSALIKNKCVTSSEDTIFDEQKKIDK